MIGTGQKLTIHAGWPYIRGPYNRARLYFLNKPNNTWVSEINGSKLMEWIATLHLLWKTQTWLPLKNYEFLSRRRLCDKVHCNLISRELFQADVRYLLLGLTFVTSFYTLSGKQTEVDIPPGKILKIVSPWVANMFIKYHVFKLLKGGRIFAPHALFTIEESQILTPG